MISILQIEYALALEKEQNFQKAAKKCFVTQPTLSMQIQKMEESLECTIFDRTRKPVIPTETGNTILKQFKIIQEEFQKIDSIINFSKGEISGTFNLGIIPTISSYLIPKLIPSFLSKYPKIRLNIKERKTEEIIKDLKSGDLDGGILSTPLSETSLNYHRLFDEPFYIIHSNSFTLKNPTNIENFIKLDRDKMLLLEEGNCFRNQAFDLCQISKNPTEKIGFPIEFSNIATLIKVLEKGNFYSLIPYYQTLDFNQDKSNFNISPFKDSVPVREISLVSHRSKIKEAQTQVLMEFIVDNLPPPPSIKGKTFKLMPQ